MTDQDVIDLYRCLLARAPEAENTVAAFRAYYPDFARGRQAILQSEEFRQLYDGMAGNPAARLTEALLRRAGGAWMPGEGNGHACSGTMRMVLRAHGGVRLAVVVGDAAAPLADLLPGLPAQAAVLHIDAAFPPVLPQTGTLAGGATVFRLGHSAEACAALLREAGLSIDVLILARNEPEALDALRPALAGGVILLGLSGLPESVESWPDIETPPAPAGMALRFQNGWHLPLSARFTQEREDGEAPVPGLCVAAILRNEADAVPHMLRSAAPVAASFALADTGSADGTEAAVRHTLAALGTPYTLRGIAADRFDDMRNAALDLAPPGTRWVLMLDADEALTAADRDALRRLLRSAEAPAYSLPRYNYTTAEADGAVAPYPDRQVRLLRWDGPARPRYSGAVHETIRNLPVTRLPLDARALGGDAGGPHIHHLVRRYRSAEAEARKQQNYRDIAARFGA